MNRKLLAVAVLALAATSWAQAQVPRVRLFTNAGYNFGGDSLASGNYLGGDNWDIRAGQGVMLAVGADVRVAENFSLRASVGRDYDSTDAVNGRVSFTRTPIELLGLYQLTPHIQLGGGARQARAAHLDATGVVYGQVPAAGAYDSSVGAVLEGVYLFTPVTDWRKPLWGINLRLVSESFKQRDGGDRKSGDHVALGFVFMY